MNDEQKAKRREGSKRYRDRRAADVIASCEVDRIVLDAIDDDAGDYESIQLRLAAHRLAAVADALSFDGDGRLIRWAH